MSETVINQQENNADPHQDGRQQNAFVRRIVGSALSIVMIALGVYVYSLQDHNTHTLFTLNELYGTSSDRQAGNYRTYVKQYKDTKEQLDITTAKLDAVEKQLDAVTAELAATRGLLSETQSMLSLAQAENARLKEEIQGLDALRNVENVKTLPELEEKITHLKQKNVQVTSELNNVKNELRAFEADFKTLDEGRSLISMFRNKINLVKARMNQIRQEAYQARIAAQKEKDRIAALNGNNGYFVKDGQLVKPASSQSYGIDVKIVQ